MVIDPAIANDIFMLGGYDRGWVSISHVARSPVIFGVGCFLIYIYVARSRGCVRAADIAASGALCAQLVCAYKSSCVYTYYLLDRFTICVRCVLSGQYCLIV